MSVIKSILVILFSWLIVLMIISGCATKSEAVIEEPKEIPEEKEVVKEEKVEEEVEKVEEIKVEEEPEIRIVDKIEEAKKIETYNFRVEFDLDSAMIRRDYFGNVQEAIDFLNANPEAEIVKVLIEGHTDSSGSKSYNYALAKRRADRVKQLLIDELNIYPEIIEIHSYGESNPITSNKTEAGRQKNRSAVVTVSLIY